MDATPARPSAASRETGQATGPDSSPASSPAADPTPSPASLGDRAARGAGTTLGVQVLRAVLQFATVVVLARLLTPDDFGLIAMVTSLLGLADLLRDAGLSSAAVQSRTLTGPERTQLFWANLGLGTACALVAVAAAPLVEALYGRDELGPVVVALSGVLVLSGATTQLRADLTRRLRFSALAACDLGAQAAGVVVAVALAAGGAGLWALVGQQLTAAGVLLVATATAARWLPGLPRRGVPLRRFLRFGGGLLGTQLLGYVVKNVDNVALGVVAGPAGLGLYSRAYQLLMMPLNTVNAPMTGVALPVLSRVQDDDARFLRYLTTVQLVGCYVTATLFTVAAGLADPLVAVLFGPVWTGVAPVFAVLALGGVFRAVSQVAYWTYLAKGLPGAQLRLSLWLTPLMVACLLAGLPWGALGVAVGHGAAYALQWAVQLVHVGRVTGVPTRPLVANAVRVVAVVSAPCGLLALLATQAPVPAAVQLLLGVLLAALWAGAACVVVPGVRADARTLAGLARRAVRR